MESLASLGPRDHDGSPLRNSALEEAMREVSRHDSPESRALLYQLLLDALVVVALPGAPVDPGSRTAERGESIAVVTGVDEDGSVLPVFTNADAVLAWRSERQGVMTLPARSVLQMAASQGTDKIVINPGSATWGFVTRREIRALALGRLPHPDGSEVVTEETAVRIGRPSPMPSDEAVAAVVDHLVGEPTAQQAWVFLIQQGESPPETAVAVDFADDPGDPRHRLAMRRIVERSGARSAEAAAFVFLTADESWRATLSGGAGIEVFRRWKKEV